jgi:DNA-binding transcriptional LysR family regulator
VEHRQRFPNVQTHLVDGSSDHLISHLASSAVDIAFLLQGNSRWDGRSLSVWSERIVAAIPEHHPLNGEGVIRWGQLRGAQILMPQRGPGPEFHNLLVSKIGRLDEFQIQIHDASLDRLLTLVGVGAGILLALEGATGATYPGVAFREVHDHEGQTRLGFRAIWRQENCNPSLRPILDMLRERYPDLSGA